VFVGGEVARVGKSHLYQSFFHGAPHDGLAQKTFKDFGKKRYDVYNQ
jgi:hypothetical protein